MQVTRSHVSMQRHRWKSVERVAFLKFLNTSSTTDLTSKCLVDVYNSVKTYNMHTFVFEEYFIKEYIHTSKKTKCKPSFTLIMICFENISKI